MILSELKNYVKARGQVSLADAALHFDVEPDAARGMLEFWVSKGRMRRIEQSVACADSCRCSQQEQLEIYCWNSELGQISIETRS